MPPLHNLFLEPSDCGYSYLPCLYHLPNNDSEPWVTAKVALNGKMCIWSILREMGMQPARLNIPSASQPVECHYLFCCICRMSANLTFNINKHDVH